MKWAERTAMLIKTARLEHASYSCFGMSILLCWSGEDCGTPTLLLLASIWVAPALWLCGCVAVWPRFCSLSFPDEPSPYWINHGPMALPFSRTPATHRIAHVFWHPNILHVPVCEVCIQWVFFPLVSIHLLWNLLPQLNHLQVVLMCLYASVTSLKWGCQLHRPDRIALSISRICKTSG